MRATALMMTMSLAAAAAAGPDAPLLSGDEWLGMYQAGDAGREAAAAYVAGYLDGVRAADPDGGRAWCLGGPVNELELAAAVARYLAARPVFRRMGAPFILDRALAEAWPCR